MKKVLLTLVVIYFSFLRTCAQLSDNSVAVQRWQGIWQGTTCKDTIILHIIQTIGPAEKDLKDKQFIGMYGWHSIKQKGIVIESSIENADNKWNDKVTITSGYKNLSDSMHLVIKDLTRNMLLGADMILISKNEAILYTWMKETWRNDKKNYPTGQTFPQIIRLFRSTTECELLNKGTD